MGRERIGFLLIPDTEVGAGSAGRQPGNINPDMKPCEIKVLLILTALTNR